MPSSLIGSLRVALSLGTAEFESGANKAAQIARSKSKEIEGAFNGAKTAVAGLFAAFTVGFLAEQIKKSLDYAGSLAEVSRTLGVTTKDLQTFRYAASQTGVAQDQLEVGLRRLTVSIGKSKLGSEAQTKAFEKLAKVTHMTVAEFLAGNTGDVFRRMADGLSKVTDRSQRAAVEMILMGRSGSQLDNLLAPGSKRLNELAEAAQTLGIVLSDSQIQGAEETAHKLAAVKEVLAAQIAGVVANNASAILSLSSALAALTGEIVHFLGSNPQLALGIVGALLGGRVGGLPGAAIGVVGGVALGNKLAQSQADSNTDLGFRTQQMRAAQQAYSAAQKAPDLGGRVLPGIGGQASAGGAANIKAARDEFIRQIGLLKAATAETLSRNAPAPRGVDLPKFLASPGKTKRAPRDRSDDVEYQFAQQLTQADMDILSARQQLSHDYQEQAAIALQMLDLQTAAKDAEIAHRVDVAKRDFAEGKITKSALDQVTAEAKILTGKNHEADQLKHQAILGDEAEQRQKDIDHLKDVDFDLERQKLQTEANLAETASERRAVELRLLALAFAQEKAREEAVLADQQATEAQKAEARKRLEALTGQYAVDRQGVLQQTRGPIEQYLASLPTTAAKWTEALQGVAVDGFGAIESSADALAGKIVKVGGIFGDVTRKILADLLKLELQKFILAPLANALGSVLGGTGSGLGQSLYPVVNGVDPLAALPGHALGGSLTIGGMMGTDRNLVSVNGVPVARASYGETLNFSNDNAGSRGGIVVNQTIAPNFAGNAATQEDLVRMGIITRNAAIQAITETQRRRS